MTKITDLFFARRFPWRKKYLVSETWIQPSNFDEQIGKENFIIEADLTEPALKNSNFAKDVQILKKYLLTDHYFPADAKAKCHQGKYFRYQWVLVIASFVATLVATVAVGFTSNSPLTNQSVPQVVEVTAEPGSIASTDTPPTNANVQTTSNPIVIILTSVVACVTTIFTALIQGENPQSTWYKNRTIAEALRRNYFIYLAHLPPYDKDDHEDVLRQQVANIATGEKEITATSTQDRTPHTPEELKLFALLYNERRAKFQHDYYRDATEEYKANSSFVRYGGVVLGAVGILVVAFNSIAGSLLWLVLVIALLPVFAALLASFEKIYGWSRQVSLYEDAQNRLIRDAALAPNELTAPTVERMAKFVTAVENTLKSEMDQWGQLASKKES